MYSRAGLSRIVTLVVALSLTAVSTGALARALDAADTKSAGAMDLDRSNGATIGSDTPVSLEPRRLPGPTPVDIHAPAQHDATATRLIERIRKVE
ncbi:MAG: hypothetical protein ABIL01_14985 [Pseudomonadota bacterium]